VDRLAVLMLAHFTLEMLEVMHKLKSQSADEHLRASLKVRALKWVVYISYTVIHVPIIAIRFIVRYKKYFL
jgi:hypothetical protein